MNKFSSLIVIGLLLLNFGCSRGKLKQNLLPGVSGKAGEVVIVMEKESWKSEAGKAIKSLFLQDVPGLPQSEPLLDPIQIPSEAFSEIFKVHRNILYTRISSSVEKPEIIIEHDKWSRPQIVISIYAPDNKSFVSLFNEKQDEILGLFLKAERDRLTSNYNNYPEQDVINKLEKSAGIKLSIPKGYTYDMDTNNFIWISHETPEISQGIFVYYYDYKDTSEFSKLALINKRDEILQKYVAGPREGSYMTTELQVLPYYRTYYTNGQFTAELRGLWKVEGDYMGGPFVSISRIDKYRNRIVTVEGYVYAPKYDKRNYLRQLEAILYSLEIVPPAPPQNKKQ